MTSGMDIYQSVILEHNRAPRGTGEFPDASHRAEGFNPICGDRVMISLKINSQRIERLGFEANCCALCRASCSVLVETFQGLATDHAKEVVNGFDSMLTGGPWLFGGDACAFAAIKDYPARKKCVTLPWKTFLAALSAPVLAEPEANAPSRVVLVSTEGEGRG